MSKYAPVETRDMIRSKNCYFSVNGDEFSPKSKICLHHKIKTFDGIKSELTDSLFKKHSRPGGVRNIYTPVHGHRIKYIEDFVEGEHYVVSGNDKFKPLRYKTIEDPRKRFLRHKGQYDKNKYVTPVVHNHHYQNQPGKAGYQAKLYTGLRLRVHINGEYERGAHVVKIEPQDIGNMQKICRTIEEYLGIPPILHMYKIEGNNDYSEVATAEELRKDDRVLVLTNHAASRKIIQANYHTDGLHQIRSPRAHHTYKDTFPSPTDPRYTLNRHQRPLPSIGSSSKQSDAVSPFSNPPSQGGRKQNNRGGNRKTKEVNYDRDQGGVYKAKNGNTHGAREVNESKETRTELPVDQREAEEVEEDRNMDEQADNSHRIDEFEDESFNQTYDQNASARNNTQRSSTPTSRGETRRSLDPASRGEVRQSPAPPSRGEARREQERKEHEAATKIQAGARGRKVRKEYNARKEGAKREQEMNERRLEEEKQALREEEEQLRQRQQAEQQQAKSMNEDEAASKIQASFKGYKTRKDIGIKKQQGQK